MNPLKSFTSPARLAPRALVALLSTLSLATLVACGGGGSSPPDSTLTTASISVTRYGAAALVTLTGAALDSSGLSVSSAGCKNMTRLNSGATLSTATTAYYGCTVSGAFSSTVSIKSNGTTIGNPSFSVAAPQVTFVIDNGLAAKGSIVLTLAGDKAPITVDNFLSYVNSGFYDNTIFQRIVQDFVIQGGGYTATVNGQLPAAPKTPNAPVAYEPTGISNAQWTIAMANQGTAVSTTSQFFINAVDNSAALDGRYAAFGSITTGIDVAQAILAAPATCAFNSQANTTDCLPQPDVLITSALQTQ